MTNSIEKILLLIILLFIYGLQFYFLQTSQLRLDFASFYSAANAYIEGANPYTNLVASYFSAPTKLPANLNPPFFLQLLGPLTYLNFNLAASTWYLCSFVLGIFGALLSFRLSCPADFFKKYWINLLFIYLGMYSTFMNAGIGQIGSILLFFIITGYHFYLQKQDYLAGGFWGFIIAIKLFPALLFFFVLNQKRYKVFVIMFITCFLAFLLPYLMKGSAIYSLYFNMLPRVTWFGDNWNASLNGFLYRLFSQAPVYENLRIIKSLYLFLFSLLLLCYIYKIKQFKKTASTYLDHREFNLTLMMMLFLSPFGWIYYFSLLLMPFTMIWQTLNQRKRISNQIKILWTISLFLINFPLGYAVSMKSLLSKLSIYSMHFYGLIIIIYLYIFITKTPAADVPNNIEIKAEYTYPIKLSFALGLFISTCAIIAHL